MCTRGVHWVVDMTPTNTPRSHVVSAPLPGLRGDRSVREEYETLDDARQGIGGYVDRYHHRPHSRLDHKTPYEVKQT